MYAIPVLAHANQEHLLMQVSLPQISGLSKTPNDMSFSHELHLTRLAHSSSLSCW